MKKFVLLLLAVFSLVGLVGCSCKEENGEGEFKLSDFSYFVNFLQNLNSEDYIKKMGKQNASK